MSREEMAPRRRREAAAAGRVIGAEYVTWDWPDGELLPNLEVRHQVIREIRSFAPDLVLTHRPYDYHPDHRAVGLVVQDASFLVTVPHVVPEAPALRKDPVVACMVDLFTRPVPLAADVVLDITERVDTVTAMLACHESQCFEWLPYLAGTLDQVPAGETQRRQWIRAWYAQQIRPRADRYRKELIATYGAEWGSQIEFAEVFEVSPYGSPLDDDARRRLFPV
jgi:LmbE family N-acetylglucosaminyl deacetylase